MMNAETIKVGRDALTKLRGGYGNYMKLINNLNEVIATGVTLEQLGTNLAEIDEFPLNNAIRIGEFFLFKLRNGEDDYDNLFSRLINVLATGVTLEQLGTSQIEINGLPLVYARQKAKNALIQLRRGASNTDGLIDQLSKAFVAGVTFEQLGTNCAEMSQFVYYFSETEVGEIVLLKLRCGYGSYYNLMGKLKKALASGVTLEQLGTNQAEVDGFPLVYALESGKIALNQLRSGSACDLWTRELRIALVAGITLEQLGTNQAEIDGLSLVCATEKSKTALSGCDSDYRSFKDWMRTKARR